jgi:hypothetical protein
MTPKEKAKELLFKFNPKGVYWVYDNITFNSGHIYELMNRRLAFDCINPLIIAVDEILEALKIDLDKDLSTIDVANFVSNKIIYWEEVKQEIEKL